MDLPSEEEAEIEEGCGLPNARYSSDHICLMTEFRCITPNSNLPGTALGGGGGVPTAPPPTNPGNTMPAPSSVTQPPNRYLHTTPQGHYHTTPRYHYPHGNNNNSNSNNSNNPGSKQPSQP